MKAKPAVASVQLTRNTNDAEATKKKQKKKGGNWKNKIRVEDRLANEGILKRMQNQISFLVNPRFRKKSSDSKQKCCFIVDPPVAEFTGYKVGQIYETTVAVRNATTVTQRLQVLPPSTPYFSISHEKFPAEGGDIAPGLSCDVTIQFCPDSLADFEDFMTVLNEGEPLKVRLKAFRPPPKLTIPMVLDCKCCLVGNRSTVVFKCANKGGAGRFRLLPASEWPRPSANVYAYREIDIEPFRISPAEFSLSKGDSVDIKVLYSPGAVGTHERKFVMVCDNCQVKTFTVKGTSCLVDLSITALDEKEVNMAAPNTKQPSSVLFEDTTIGAIKKRTVRIRNPTPIELSMHWAVYEESKAAGKSGRRQSSLVAAHLSGNEVFDIEPKKATVQGQEEQTFVISFKPGKACAYTHLAKLVVEDVPPTAVEGYKFKDKSKKKKSSVENAVPEENGAEEKNGETPETNEAAGNDTPVVPPLGEVPSDDRSQVGLLMSARSKASLVSLEPLAEPQFLNIPFKNLRLLGPGCQARLQLEPQVLNLAGKLLVGKAYTRMVTLKNLSDADVPLTWCAARDKTAPGGVPRKHSLNVEPCECTIPAKGTQEFEFTFVPQESGSFCLEIECHALNGHARGSWVQLVATSEGPRVRIDEPEIDFGLVGVGEVVDYDIPFTNLSDVAAVYRFCKAGDPQQPFVCETALEKEKESKARAEVDRSRKKCNVLFNPKVGTVGPMERGTVRVTCKAGWKPERLRAILECRVQHSRSQYARVRAEVQSPKVYIDVTKFELGTTCVTVPVARTIKITNLSNLPAHFCWSLVGGKTPNFEAKFSVEKGTLHAKESRDITFTYIAQRPGRNACIFSCVVEGMQAPLGFTLRTVSKGLVVAYTLASKEAKPEDLAPPMPKDGTMHKSTPSTKIPILDFGDDLKLCERSIKRLCLTNHSAIPTSFTLTVRSFAANMIPPSLGGKAPPPASSTMALSSSFLPGGSLADSKNASTKFGAKKLGDRHEVTGVYVSKAGRKHVTKKLQAREDMDVLGGGNGVAFLCTPKEGQLAPWTSVIVDVVCFNNMPGKYKDELICQVKGLPQTRISMKVRVVGSPLELSVHTVGLDPNVAPPRLAWANVLHSTKSQTKRITVKNNGPVDSMLRWDVRADREEDADLVETSFVCNDNGALSLKIQPHRDLVNPPPFDVVPRKGRVPAYGKAHFHVTYHTGTEPADGRATMVADGFWLTPETNPDDILSVSSSKTSLAITSSKASLAVTNSKASLASVQSVQTSATISSKNATREPMKKCLKLALKAKSVEAGLHLDRARREDGYQYLCFKVWSEYDTDHRSFFKTLAFTNTSGAMQALFMQVSRNFTINSTSTTAPKPRLSSDQLGKIIPQGIDQEEAMKHVFCIPPGGDLSVTVRFRPRSLDATIDVSNRPKAQEQNQICCWKR